MERLCVKDLTGTTLGKYAMVARLGAGGMATVYKAYQPRLDRHVAIKVLHGHLVEEMDFVSRFEREAAAVARLNHPHVVKIYDFDAEDGLYYIVMEFIQGPTLQAEIHARQQEQRPFTLRETAKIALPLVDAVGYAHTNGVVHRDVKPANVMLTGEGNVVLTDFGLAYIVGMTQFTAAGTTSGTPEYMAPEQVRGERGDERSDLYALGVVLYEMVAGRRPFHGETPFATMMEHVSIEPAPPTRFNPALSLAVEGVILTALEKEPARRYQSAAEMADALRAALEQVHAPLTPVALLAPAPAVDAVPPGAVTGDLAGVQRPYRGLFAFRKEDAPFFFGRETFTERLLEAVRANAMAVVVGPSGSGKSSVVLAGLFPRLEREADWIAVDFRPGSRPFHALADALVSRLEPDAGEVDRLVETGKMAQAFSDGTLTPRDVVARILQKAPAGSHLLLFADQFEELYTLCSDLGERQRFTAALLGSVWPGSGEGTLPTCALVLTLRADFMGQALGNHALAKALQRADVKLGPMTQQELAQAVEQPAARLGVSFEPGLVQRILDDVGDEPGNLPLLQFALTLLWDRRAGRRLTHAAYEAIGRVEGALARYAEKVYARLGKEERALARRVFTQMVRPGLRTEDTRRRATRIELGEDGWSLVQRLADERLLVTGEDAAGQEVGEVVHEVLIRGWRRLQEWMEADREFRSWQERLRTALRQWEIAGQDESALLRGALLAEASRWLASRETEISRAERAFIEAGTALHERESAEREAQRQRELETAQRLAQEQRARAEEQAAAAGKLRARAWVLSGMLIVAAALAVLAVGLARQSMQNAGRAEEQRQIAETQRSEAESRRREAEEQRQLAEEQRAEAERQRTIALARQLAAQSTTLLDEHVDLGLLLSLESQNLLDSAETDSSLLAALQYHPRLLTFLRGHTGTVEDLIFSPDGTRLASSSTDSTARLWSVDRRPDGTLLAQPLGGPLVGHAENEMVNGIAFSPDGTLLASSCDDRTIRLWDVDSGAALAVLSGHTDYVQDVTFNADGRQLLSVGGDAVVRVWDVETLQQTAALTGHNDAIWHVLTSPDGQTLATASQDGSVILWDLATLQRRGEPLVHDASVAWIDFSPDGQRLASLVVGNQEIQLWDVATGQSAGSLTVDHASYPLSCIFIDDRTLATRSYTEIKFWDVDTGEPADLPPLAGKSALRLAMDASPDGRLLATNSNEGVIMLWDLSGKLGLRKQAFANHATYLRSVAFHPEGHVMASAGYDGRIVFRDVESGAPAGDAMVHAMPGVTSLSALALDPTGQHLVATHADGTLVGWALDGTGYQGFNRTHAYGDVVAAYSADGTWIASGGMDGRITLWYAASERAVNAWTAHQSGIRCLAFSPAEFLLLSGAGDGTLIVWENVPAGFRPRAELPAHTGGVRSLATSPDGRWAASGGEEGDMALWSLTDGELLARLPAAHAAPVLALALLQDPDTGGYRLFSAGGDGAVLRWDFNPQAAGNLPGATPVHAGGMAAASAAFSAEAVALGGENGSVEVRALDPDAGASLLAVSTPGEVAVTCLALAGRQVFAGGADGLVRAWDLDLPAEPRELALEGPIPISALAIVYTPDGQTLVSAGFNGSLILWDVATGQPRRPPLIGHVFSVPAVAVSPDGALVASGGCGHRSWEHDCDRGEIILWDVQSGQLRSRLSGHVQGVLGLAFSPDGATLASSSCAATDVGSTCTLGEVLLWDVASGEQIASLQAHAQWIGDVAFSPDGRLLATASPDGIVLLWDVATGQQVGQRLLGYGGEVFAVAFSPDGSLLASAGGGEYTTQGYVEGQITLWDVATGRQIGLPFRDHHREVRDLAFSADGQWLASGSMDGTVMVWDVRRNVWRERACHIANRNLSLEEWEQFFGAEPYRETCAGLLPADN